MNLRLLVIAATIAASVALLLRSFIALPGHYANRAALSLAGGDTATAASLLAVIEILYLLSLIAGFLCVLFSVSTLWQKPRHGVRLYGVAALGLILAASGPMDTLIYRTATAAWRDSNPPQVRLVLAFDEGSHLSRPEALIEATLVYLERRLTRFGQFHAPRGDGAGNILVGLSGMAEDEVAELRRMITETYLGFYLVHPDSDRLAATAQSDGYLPGGYRSVPGEAGLLVVEDEPRLTGADVNDAQSIDRFQSVSLLVRFTESGERVLKDVTANNIGRRFAVVLGDRVVSAPVIRETITDGQAELAVGLSIEETDRLARDLALGGLPAPLVIVSEGPVGQ